MHHLCSSNHYLQRKSLYVFKFLILSVCFQYYEEVEVAIRIVYRSRAHYYLKFWRYALDIFSMHFFPIMVILVYFIEYVQ